MASITEYAEQTLHTFSQRPFSEVDSLVLSQLSYIHLDAVFTHAADPEIRDFLRAEAFEGLFRGVRAAAGTRRLLTALAASPRFRNMRAGSFSEKTSRQREEQFAAVTFYPDDRTACIVFRGTDSTLVGWKEDFNMAFMPRVPAQADAAAYANQIGAAFPGRLLLCGHSKGGNLAIYAAAMCAPEIQARIDAVYAHDSPGFSRAVLESAGYRRIQPRIRKTIPQSSLIGMLLESHDQYTVVESRQSGIMQHDPFSWVIEDGAFRTLEKITAGAEFMNDTLDDWIAGMSIAERERFVDALYDILSAGGITSIFDFGGNLPQRLSTMRSAAAGLDPKTREFLFQIVTRLAGYAVKNLAKFPKPSGLIQP